MVASKPIYVGVSPCGLCVDSNNALWAVLDAGKKLVKIADGRVAGTFAIGCTGQLQSWGDFTGMQAALLFGWNRPPALAPVMSF